MSPLLAVEAVTKRFGGLTAVKEVGFDLDPGEIVGILGPNGAGKTTLFNLLTGFIRPDSGRVRFAGQAILGLAPARIVNLGLARTFQLCRPFTGLSVLENVMVACYAPRAQAAGVVPTAHAMAMLEQVGLGDKTMVAAQALSYGDQRRLEIARALATGPDLLLLDEPFAGLGASEIEPLAQLIRRLHRERNLTILIIEHKLQEFMQLVHRVIALDFGEIIATGTPAQIVREPKVIEAYIGRQDDDHAAA